MLKPSKALAVIFSFVFAMGMVSLPAFAIGETESNLGGADVSLAAGSLGGSDSLDESTRSGSKLKASELRTASDTGFYEVKVLPCEGGTVRAVPEEAAPGETVALVVEPGEGMVLRSATAVDSVGSAVDVANGTWHGAGPATFVMPASDVTVSASFCAPTAAGGLSALVPSSSSAAIAVPAGVSSFKVYDHGGPDGGYANGCNGSLTIAAPEGMRLQLSGSVDLEAGFDGASFRDGASADAPALVNGLEYDVSGYYSGRSAGVGLLATTGGLLTVALSSDSSGTGGGLDLTVEVVDPAAAHAVTVLPCEGGSVRAVPEQAAPGQTVELVAEPGEGFLLAGASVTDAAGRPVGVSGGWHAGGVASFVMPASAVDVAPSFTSDLTVAGGLAARVPASGSASAAVPVGVSSFKVYDNGGPDGGYAKGCDGSLTLTAPEGMRLRVTGTVSTAQANGADRLTLLDGASADSPALSNSRSLDGKGGYWSRDGGAYDIGALEASGGSLTVRFSSSSRGAGLDLAVEVIPNSYAITYNLDGGTNATGNHTRYTTNATPVRLYNPVKEGFAFLGWYTDEACSPENQITEIPLGSEGDITLWAKWGAHAHDWTFTAQGAVITATCHSEGHIGPEAPTLTIVAPKLTVYGTNANARATIAGDIDGIQMPPIVYKKDDTVLSAAPTKPGDYTASITVGDATATVSYTIAKAPLTVTAKDQTIDEGGSIAQGVDQVTAVGLVAGDSLTNVTLAAEITGKNTGRITPSAAETANGVEDYEVTYVDGVLSITLAPAAVVSAPAAVSGLSYNGANQALVTAGEAESGTMMYSLDGKTWSEDIPSATAAGDYQVGYYVEGDEDHLSTEPASVDVTIAHLVVGLEWSDAQFVYNGSSQAPTAVATGLVEGDTCEVTMSGAGINAGTYTATASALSNANYALPTEVEREFTIERAQVAKPVAREGLVYNGEAQTGVEGDDGYEVEGGSATAAGSYTATATLDANHAWADGSTVAASVKWSIAKAANPAKVTAKAKTIKLAKVKKKARTTIPITVKDAQGVKVFKVSKWNTKKAKKYFKVNAKSGKVKVKKGTPKGTYKFTVTVTAAGNANYESKTVSKKVTIEVK